MCHCAVVMMHGKSHISDGVGVPVAKAKLNKRVRWLGYNWSPMLDEDSIKNDLEEMVVKAARQLKKMTVSSDSTLYLCDLVVCGGLNYKVHVVVLNRDEMKQLERRFRHIYLDACALQISVAKTNLPAGLGGLGWTTWLNRLMKNRVTLLNKMIGTATPMGFVFRWAVEQFHERVASGEPVGSSGRVQGYVSQKYAVVFQEYDRKVRLMLVKELRAGNVNLRRLRQRVVATHVETKKGMHALATW